MAEKVDAMATARPVIDYLLWLRYRLESGQHVEISATKKEITGLIRDMEVQLLKIPGMHAHIKTIQYIFAALCDEIILNSNWTFKNEWLDTPLEMEFSESNIAGKHFFELLEEEGFDDPVIAEFFYTCLIMGFGSNRRGVDVESMKRRLYMMLPQKLPDDERFLSPGAQAALLKKEIYLPPMLGATALIVIVIVSAGIYLTASHWLWRDAAELIHNISNALLAKGY